MRRNRQYLQLWISSEEATETMPMRSEPVRTETCQQDSCQKDSSSDACKTGKSH